MKKSIFITGATDGIGYEAAKKLASHGHNLWVHGRNKEKVYRLSRALKDQYSEVNVVPLVADLSDLKTVDQFAHQLVSELPEIDVIVNNAGVFKTEQANTLDMLDIRFAVNTIAPYILTKSLLPVLSSMGRIVNVASAAQAPIDLEALAGKKQLSDGEAYAQSKLALIMWTHSMAIDVGNSKQQIFAVNPASLLGTKMVKEGYGIEGKDLRIGAEVLFNAATGEQFSNAHGKYFDNDIGKFSNPHPDVFNAAKVDDFINTMEQIIIEVAMTNSGSMSA